MKHDVAVVGLGAVGAATLYQLAKRGLRVVGIDRFPPPHALGSSHGESRITRLAIGEGDEYVPLVRRSHEIWREIGEDLLVTTGGLWISSPARQADSHVADFFAKTLSAALYSQKTRISQRKRRKVVRKACRKLFMSSLWLGFLHRHPQSCQRIVAEIGGLACG